MFTTTLNGSIALVVMHHGKVNAMDLEFCQEFSKRLDKMSQADDISSVVLTGSGRVFSAGIDLKRLLAETPDYIGRFLDAFEAMIDDLFRFPKPIVAAINGPAIAGGCIMSSACDYRVALQAAKIGIPELRIGVPLPIICVEVMRSIVASHAFYEIVNIGATFHGRSAVDVGLVNELGDHENLQATAMEKAEHLQSIPGAVFALSKRQLRFPYLSQAQSLQQQMGAQMREIWQSDWLRQIIHEYVNARLG